MESNRVLVTGCSGYLGRYVARQLSSAGHEVVGFDLVEPDYPLDSFTKGDFTVRIQFEDALQGVTSVCHLGGVGDVYLAEADPARAFRANAFGTKVVCDACARLRIEKLVFASTWEVYGQPQRDLIEETHPCNPESPYSISKLAGELFVRQANKRPGLKTVALRLGTAYGPRMRESTVISRFIRRALERKPLTIFGNGAQTRQFTHVDDIGHGFVLALSDSAPGHLYNLLSDEPISMLNLAALLAKEYGTTIEYEPAKPSEPPSAHISAEKALRELGWRKSVSFREGLRSLIAERQSTQGV